MAMEVCAHEGEDISWMKEESGELYLKVPKHMVHKIDKALVPPPPSPPSCDTPDSTSFESIEHARSCEGKRYCKCCLEREMFCMPPDSLDSRTLVGRLRRKLAERPYKEEASEASNSSVSPFRELVVDGDVKGGCGDINALVDFIESGNPQAAAASSRKVKRKQKGAKSVKTISLNRGFEAVADSYKNPGIDVTVACFNSTKSPALGTAAGNPGLSLGDDWNLPGGEPESECAVCFTLLSRRHALHPCGHNLFCADCHELLVSAFKLCPLCRTPIEKAP